MIRKDKSRRRRMTLPEPTSAHGISGAYLPRRPHAARLSFFGSIFLVSLVPKVSSDNKIIDLDDDASADASIESVIGSRRGRMGAGAAHGRRSRPIRRLGLEVGGPGARGEEATRHTRHAPSVELARGDDPGGKRRAGDGATGHGSTRPNPYAESIRSGIGRSEAESAAGSAPCRCAFPKAPSVAPCPCAPCVGRRLRQPAGRYRGCHGTAAGARRRNPLPERMWPASGIRRRDFNPLLRGAGGDSGWKNMCVNDRGIGTLYFRLKGTPV